MDVILPQMRIQMRLNIVTDGPGQVHYTTGFHTNVLPGMGGILPLPAADGPQIQVLEASDEPTTADAETSTPYHVISPSDVEGVPTTKDQMAQTTEDESDNKHKRPKSSKSGHGKHKSRRSSSKESLALSQKSGDSKHRDRHGAKSSKRTSKSSSLASSYEALDKVGRATPTRAKALEDPGPIDWSSVPYAPDVLWRNKQYLTDERPNNLPLQPAPLPTELEFNPELITPPPDVPAPSVRFRTSGEFGSRTSMRDSKTTSFNSSKENIDPPTPIWPPTTKPFDRRSEQPVSQKSQNGVGVHAPRPPLRVLPSSKETQFGIEPDEEDDEPVTPTPEERPTTPYFDLPIQKTPPGDNRVPPLERIEVPDFLSPIWEVPPEPRLRLSKQGSPERKPVQSHTTIPQAATHKQATQPPQRQEIPSPPQERPSRPTGKLTRHTPYETTFEVYQLSERTITPTEQKEEHRRTTTLEYKMELESLLQERRESMKPLGIGDWTIPAPRDEHESPPAMKPRKEGRDKSPVVPVFERSKTPPNNLWVKPLDEGVTNYEMPRPASTGHLHMEKDTKTSPQYENWRFPSTTSRMSALPHEQQSTVLPQTAPETTNTTKPRWDWIEAATQPPGQQKKRPTEAPPRAPPPPPPPPPPLPQQSPPPLHSSYPKKPTTQLSPSNNVETTTTIIENKTIVKESQFYKARQVLVEQFGKDNPRGHSLPVLTVAQVIEQPKATSPRLTRKEPEVSYQDFVLQKRILPSAKIFELYTQPNQQRTAVQAPAKSGLAPNALAPEHLDISSSIDDERSSLSGVVTSSKQKRNTVGFLVREGSGSTLVDENPADYIQDGRFSPMMLGSHQETASTLSRDSVISELSDRKDTAHKFYGGGSISSTSSTPRTGDPHLAAKQQFLRQQPQLPPMTVGVLTMAPFPKPLIQQSSPLTTVQEETNSAPLTATPPSGGMQKRGLQQPRSFSEIMGQPEFRFVEHKTVEETVEIFDPPLRLRYSDTASLGAKESIDREGSDVYPVKRASGKQGEELGSTTTLTDENPNDYAQGRLTPIYHMDDTASEYSVQEGARNNSLRSEKYAEIVRRRTTEMIASPQVLSQQENVAVTTTLQDDRPKHRVSLNTVQTAL